MNKKELREEYLKLRKIISDKDIKSNIINKKILDNEKYKLSNIVGVYVNLLNEVSTKNFILDSLNKNKTICVPVVFKNGDMQFYKIVSLVDLKKTNSLNIKEPIPNQNNLILPNQIDLLILPGVCFDKNKNRIGYGGGYYDRYLLLANNSYNIGICFDEQLYNGLIDIEDNDMKVDEIITEKRLIK